MKKFFLVALICGAFSWSAIAQTCTVSGTGTINWDPNTTPVCVEGGNATDATTIIIPTGVVLLFDNNADTWAGSTIIVIGTLRIAANITIDASIEIRSGGRLIVNSSAQLNLGTGGPSCDYNLIIHSGGRMDFFGTNADDKLRICGQQIAWASGGSCNADYPNGSPPYCEPSQGYFSGPTAFDKNGYNGTLPVEIVAFTATNINKLVNLKWISIKEENFRDWEIQRSSNGSTWETIATVPGAGRNTFEVETKYSFDDRVPLVGRNYYRLKAVDLDGSFEYFGPRTTLVDGKKRIEVLNPSSGSTVSFKINFTPSDVDRAIIVDQLGTVLYTVQVKNTETNLELPNDLKPGLYFVRYISAEYQGATRLFVKD